MKIISDKNALGAAQIIHEYCYSKPFCKGCIFLFEGECLLKDLKDRDGIATVNMIYRKRVEGNKCNR